jgi:hypothetical protein
MSPAERSRITFPTAADAVSMVAAHGISERVIATWDPRLVRTPRVLVPIVVDALVVGADGATFADCAMRAPTDDDDRDGDGLVAAGSLLPPPFTDLAEARPPGAYLHWALPDGLTAGEVGTDAGGTGTVSLPAVPDRWLVARIGPSATPGRRAVTGWVLEAGGASPRVTPLDDWVEPGAATDVVAPLTALGHGDPAWAAYYDNVVDRLGFYDDLSGVKAGPVAYLVCGWYASSDPGRDPLGSGITTLGAFDTTMAAHGWSLADGELKESLRRRADYLNATVALGLRQTSMVSRLTGPRVDDNGTYLTDGDWWPTGTFFHGAVVDLAWPVDPQAPDGRPGLDGLRVGLGATTSEALGTLLAATDHDPGEERALEAFQLGALHELDEADGPARIEAALHASAFGSLSGGPDDVESIWVPPVPAQPGPPAAPGTPDPGIFARRPSHPVGGFGGFDSPVKLSGAEVSVRLGQAATEDGITSAKVAGASAKTGRFSDVLDAVALDRADLGTFIGTGGPVPAPPVTPVPGHYEDVRRAQPRFFHPTDPVLLVQGARRSFKHGADDRYADDDTLVCRLSGFTVHSVTVDLAGRAASRATVTGDQLLDRLTDNGSLPLDCDDLLRETVLLDPGSAAAIELILTPRTQSDGLRRNVLVEQTAWWSLRDPRIDPAPIVSRSGLAGTLPSPLAVTPAHPPWNPLHLDWEVEFTPAPGGIGDFRLGELDLETALLEPPPDGDQPPPDGAQPAPGEAALPGEAAPPPPPPAGDGPEPIVVRGRCLITANAAETLADAAQRALEAATTSGGTTAAAPGTVERLPSALAVVAVQNWTALSVELAGRLASTGTGGSDSGGLSAAERAELAGLVEHLADMDVLGGVLDGVHQQLRGGVPMIRQAGADGATDPTPLPAPPGFLPMRAGTLRISRARVVDGFGQYVDLAPLLAPDQGDPRVVVGETLRIDDAPGTALLVPRFTSAARLQLRWIDAVDDVARTGANPVCGFVLPDHLDESLELFDAAGDPLGQVRPDDTGGLLWETAPGRAATIGRSPSVDVDNLFLRGVALGLLDWGTADHQRTSGGTAPEPDDALSGLLRAIDSTMWTVDPFGHAGDEHLSMLVGHPIVVMRAVLRLEVDDPAAPAANATTPVDVRLGNLTNWQDGLLGHFVGDDYTTFHAAAAAADMAREVGPGRGFLQQIQQVPDFAEHFGDDLPDGAQTGSTPVTHPYIAPSDVITVRPNQDVRLTMLVEPHTVVHATSGLLPRKEIGMRREWLVPAMGELAPTFRFGPVLVDPKQVRLPIATDIAGTWTWTHKADVASWVEEQVTNATQDARLADDPAQAEEGWLRLTPPPTDQSGTTPPAGGTP